jgi:hypothetical protein
MRFTGAEGSRARFARAGNPEIPVLLEDVDERDLGIAAAAEDPVHVETELQVPGSETSSAGSAPWASLTGAAAVAAPAAARNARRSILTCAL